MQTATLVIPHKNHLSVEEFFEFCSQNPRLKFELSHQGEVIIMSPTGSKTGNINYKFNKLIALWEVQQGILGEGFDSSTGFELPDCSVREADFAWIEKSRWEALSEKEQEKFAAICPDFVLELRSSSDSLKALKNKMQTVWMQNGARESWLIDPQGKQTFIYLPGKEEVIYGYEEKIDSKVLKGFTFLLKDLLR